MTVRKPSKLTAAKKISGNMTYNNVLSSVSGGTPYVPGNGYEYRVFTAPGSSFTVNSTGVGGGIVYSPRSNVIASVGNPASAEVLVVADGGGGEAGNRGAGGGGGGVVYHPAYAFAVGTPYPVARSGNSSIGGLTAVSGGSAGCPGNPGGSGGGTRGHGGECPTPAQSGNQPGQTHPTAPPGWNNYGNPSGSCPPTPHVGVGAGGGGAGGSGGFSSAGSGRPFPGFEGSLWGTPGNPGTFANGGQGGGGNDPSGTSASYPFGGCGGSANQGSPSTGGVVIVRYRV